MKKIFAFFAAALMSAGMFATTYVTITQNDFPGMDVSFTKDGVTVSADWIDNMDGGHLVGPGSFSTTLGNFTKIEVNAGEFVMPLGEGWSGNSERQTWTGNASSVSFSGEINGVGHGITIMCTIEEPAPTTYTLQLVADPEKGSVAVTNLLGSDIIDNGNGNYTVPENAEVTILATPIEGYEFTGWKVGNRWCDFTDCGTALNTLDNPLTITMTEDVAYKAEFEAKAPQVESKVTLILANLPEENRPADNNIELAGTFDEGSVVLEKLNTGWFINAFIHASADATGKFRDKTNPNMVLCERIPANGDEEEKWVQAIFKISDYGYWDENGWKGTACMWTEIDVTGEQYAWMEGMPEPEPEPEPEEVTVVFAANGNTKEVTVALPHTFWCDLEYEDGELDGIIQELYALPQGGYCDYYYDGPVAEGNTAVTAGKDNDDNHFITISEAFEGTATVSGKYRKYTEMDVEIFTYTLTISIKGEGGATAISNTAVDTKAVKRIVNGQLLIIRDGKMFNLQGAQVK